MDCSTPRARAGQVAALAFTAVLTYAAAVPSSANECAGGPGSVSIGVSYSARPYVFPHANRGIQIDIVRRALGRVGYDFCPVYLPPLRAARNFAGGRLDGLLNVQTSRYNGHLSAPVITYQNCAYSLADNGITIRSFNDFANRTTVAFQGAKVSLEPAFAEATKKMANYYEVANQEMQVVALFRERVDLVVMEQRIFAYYWDQLAREAAQRQAPPVSAEQLQQPVREDCLFQPAPYRIEFANAAVRDGFNAGLQQLQETGGYQQIMQRYLPDTAVAYQ